MTKVAIYGPNLRSPGPTFHVHVDGCADLRKRLYRDYTEDAWLAEVSSHQEVVEEIYGDHYAENDETWKAGDQYDQDVKVFPCVKFEEVAP